jgi:hypothetical protein
MAWEGLRGDAIATGAEELCQQPLQVVGTCHNGAGHIVPNQCELLSYLMR